MRRSNQFLRLLKAGVFSRRGYVMQDPDAAAYVAAVESALSSSISATQKNAIDDFIKTGKSAGWYSSIKRLYLPIWADAAANAIDMISLTSGTFTASGVTHASGYVQGDGSTGYFDFGVSPSAIGMTNTSGITGALVYSQDSRNLAEYFVGSRDAGASGECDVYQLSSSQIAGMIGRQPNLALATLTTTPSGIIFANRAVTGLQIHRRSSTGIESSANVTATATNAITTRNVFAFCLNANATPTSHTDAKLGAYFAGIGMSQSDSIAFSESLKNLWETASALTLP